MPGISNESLIYPVLDLVRAEIKKYIKETDSDPFDGIPSVSLIRDYPFDEELVTGAELYYESGYRVLILFRRGTDDESKIPESIDENHPEYEYYVSIWLTEVYIIFYDADDNVIANYVISLNYNEKGLLEGTSVTRVE